MVERLEKKLEERTVNPKPSQGQRRLLIPYNNRGGPSWKILINWGKDRFDH